MLGYRYHNVSNSGVRSGDSGVGYRNAPNSCPSALMLGYGYHNVCNTGVRSGDRELMVP